MAREDKLQSLLKRVNDIWEELYIDEAEKEDEKEYNAKLQAVQDLIKDLEKLRKNKPKGEKPPKTLTSHQRVKKKIDK